MTLPAYAQDALSPGEAFATRFSGTIEITLGDGSRLTLIDESGVVGSVVDVRNPGFSADGRHWVDEPQRLPVTASEVGQVFGIAIGGGAPTDIYLSATSLFGLHRFNDGTGWLPGQWGEGGPGGLYVLRGANGYQPELLATIDLDGRPNTGAGLGNVAYDAAYGQLFVSDLETGMIHRLATDGTILDRYDHGMDGRATIGLDPIVFDPASAAAIDDCTDETGAVADFSTTPSCWNYADFRRRVFGLAVHADKITGGTRLYYAVAGADGMGNSEYPGAADDGKNSVWSIGLDATGAFSIGDVRLEVVLPDFGDAEVTPSLTPDIAISSDGILLVAERGGVRNFGLDQSEPFSHTHASRVLRYIQVEDGTWQAEGRYDVGFNDRQAIGAPYVRANAAGGVDFGYGYDTVGTIDPSRPYGSVWMSGDALCSPAGPCVNPSTGQRTDTSEVHGIQGTPVEATVDVVPAGATGVYPASGDPYPADALRASYLIDLDRNVSDSGTVIVAEALKNDATKIGDVEVYKAGAVTPGYDLDIDKSGALQCLVETNCSFIIKITNRGPSAFDGPLYLWDVIQPYAAPLVSAVGEGWACFDLNTGIHCANERVVLGVGQSTQLVITIAIPPRYRSDILTNCIAIQWIYGDNGAYDVRAVQVALALLGYNPGTADGVYGAKTRNALIAFQTDNGLEPTGEIDDATVALLYPGLIGIAGDLDSSNDFDCHDVVTGKPDPVHSKWNSHLKIGSPHNKVQSHLKVGSPHNKVQSHRKIGSPHDKRQSHLKIGSPHDKRQSHLKIGSPHDKRQSHLKIGSPHDKRQSHLKIGSPHDKRQSHLKIGSPHSKSQSHLKIGSPHDKRQSHLKNGSPHNKNQSHLKTGSPHNKIQSHLKVGSFHTKNQSHLKTGSRHSKVQSHLKTGSTHDKLFSLLK